MLTGARLIARGFPGWMMLLASGWVFANEAYVDQGGQGNNARIWQGITPPQAVSVVSAGLQARVTQQAVSSAMQAVQLGNGNTLQVEQTGSGQRLAVDQGFDRATGRARRAQANRANIFQVGRGQQAQISQLGDGGVVRVNQGGTGNRLQVYQTPGSRSAQARIRQVGRLGSIETWQDGNLERLDLDDGGVGNVLQVAQGRSLRDGRRDPGVSGNIVNAALLGRSVGNRAVLSQLGNNNRVDLADAGRHGLVDILQQGAGNTVMLDRVPGPVWDRANVTQDGITNRLNAAQHGSHEQLHVQQQGMNNEALVNQDGAGSATSPNTVDILQVGTGFRITVNQTGGPGDVVNVVQY